MPQSPIDLSIENHIATLLVNRPESLNSLSSAVLNAINEAVAQIESDADVHAAIVTGAGRAFVAGADIQELSALDQPGGSKMAQLGQRCFDRIEQLSKPVVAAVNGFALGGGCELAMACHIRLASTQARFGQPEVKLGLLPGFGGTQRLPRLVGRGIATDLLISGRMIDADEALRVGLVSEVLEPDALLDTARERLAVILKNGPNAVAASLVAAREGMDTSLQAGLAREAELFAELCATPEMLEGTAAFLEKRDARFKR